MTALLVFAVTLFVGVLLSELAGRSVLSLAVIFLAAGFFSGPGMLGWIQLDAHDPVATWLAQLALVSILFSDGMRLDLRELTANWRLPGRALIVGLPLTLLGTALLARYIGGLSWPEALLVGAVLSPTDPVFAAAIIGSDAVPQRLRHLLNVESGLNDGLALPLVLTAMALIGNQASPMGQLAGEIALGVALGIVVPWVGVHIAGSRFFSVAPKYEPLFTFSLGLLVLSVGLLTHANIYLAAFAAGITMATMRPVLHEEFHAFGETLAELLKLSAVLMFGALVSPAVLAMVPLSGYLFAVLALVAVRPLAILIAMFRSGLGWRENITAGWFGPKGFASVVFGLLIMSAAVPRAEHLFHIIAVVVAVSMIAHSSTDVLFARWFSRANGDANAAIVGAALDKPSALKNS